MRFAALMMEGGVEKRGREGCALLPSNLILLLKTQRE